MTHPPSGGPAASTLYRLSRWLCLVYVVLITYVSLAPGQRIPGIFDWGTLFSPDKAAHFTAYAIFAVLLSLAIRWGQNGPGRAATAATLAALYGVLMEVFQGIAGTGRFFDPVDMVANALGAILGGLIYLLLYKFVLQRLTSVRT